MSAKKRDKNTEHDEHADGIVEDRKQAPPLYFSILFYGLIIWGIGFSAYYLLSGWSSEKEFEEKMTAYQQTYTQAASAATVSAAAEARATGINAVSIYNASCAACHGTGGVGGFATDLTGEYVYGKDADSVRTSIADGRGAMMPGFADSLSTEEIDALVGYLLEL